MVVTIVQRENMNIQELVINVFIAVQRHTEVAAIIAQPINISMNQVKGNVVIVAQALMEVVVIIVQRINMSTKILLNLKL